MPDDQANANEGANPSDDIKKQNPGGTTTAGLTGGHDDPDRAGAGEGPDAGENDDIKTQDLAKAGRPYFDPNAGQE